LAGPLLWVTRPHIPANVGQQSQPSIGSRMLSCPEAQPTKGRSALMRRPQRALAPVVHWPVLLVRQRGPTGASVPTITPRPHRSGSTHTAFFGSTNDALAGFAGAFPLFVVGSVLFLGSEEFAIDSPFIILRRRPRRVGAP